MFERRKKEREMDMERARQNVSINNRSNNNSSIKNHHEKHVTINDNASTYEFNDRETYNQKPFSPNNDLDSELNERMDVQSESSNQQKMYQTPNNNLSKSQKNLKTINERTGTKSLMDYSQTPQPAKNHFNTMKNMPNPLFGESEGDYKRRIMNEEYREYAKKSMERSRDRSTSKRMSRHIQKRQEAQSKSPTSEVNIYSQKQRYKYSYFNQLQNNQQNNNNINNNYDYNYQSAPRPNDYQSLQDRKFKKVEEDEDYPASGYILKTDPRQVLMQKEIQKQEYSKALREQMEENQQRKQQQRVKQVHYENEYVGEFGNTRGGGGAPIRDQYGNVLTTRHNGNGSQSEYNNNGSLNNSAIHNESQVNLPVKGNKTNNMNQKPRIQCLMERKQDLKMKKKIDEEMDEERVHRQIREINDETLKEKQSRASFKRNPSPINTPRRPQINDQITDNHVAPQRELMRSQITQRRDGDTSFDSHNQPNNNLNINNYNNQANNNNRMVNDSYQSHQNNLNLRSERDQYENQIDRSLYNLRNEATQTQRDTNRALDRLNQIQSEMYLKQRQSELQSQEFYNEMMNQSKVMLSSIKYNNPQLYPFDQVLSQSRSVYSNLPLPNLGRSIIGGMKGIESEFLVPRNQNLELRSDINNSFKGENGPVSTQSANDEIDELINRF
ncbi:UNKNOWN [Stylonychia lemnae]|uniref:Uncharacterized protein n=1 Tax=Stylonychia lemnae TaxID=5949 RepID=A0A078AAI0_STYLE|nr:UNKNOWN [Stylonychia lemnae]|eukprot:CDW79214.1 UNKNOWN [Stylonychia lemnae]